MKRMIITLVAVWMMITSMNAQRLTNIQAEEIGRASCRERVY